MSDINLTDILKPREIEILHLMADGLTNREISERLYIGVETVRWYAKQIVGILMMYDPLKSREIEILYLIADGVTNDLHRFRAIPHEGSRFCFYD